MLFPIFCHFQQSYVNILMRVDQEVTSKQAVSVSITLPVTPKVFSSVPLPRSKLAITSLFPIHGGQGVSHYLNLHLPDYHLRFNIFPVTLSAT